MSLVLRQWLHRHHESLLFVLVVFVLSRILVLVGLGLGDAYLLEAAEGRWIVDHSWQSFARWDSGWYSTIVEGGYRFFEDVTLPQNIIFFPLYPLLMRGLSSLLGWHWVTSGVVISHVALLGALCFFYAFVRRVASGQTARLSIILLACSPYGVFFSAVYTESLFLLLFAVALYGWEQKRFVLAGVAAGLAGATRTQGMVLVLPFVLQGLSHIWRYKRIPTWQVLLGGVLSVAGIGLYVAYIHQLTGDWWRIPTVQQQAWQHKAFSLAQLGSTVWREFSASIDYFFAGGMAADPKRLLMGRHLDIWALFLSIFSTVFLLVRVQLRAWVWLAPGMILFNLYAISGNFSGLGRYLAVVPLYALGMALLLERTPVWVKGVVVLFGCVLLVQLAALFGGWIWVA